MAIVIVVVIVAIVAMLTLSTPKQAAPATGTDLSSGVRGETPPAQNLTTYEAAVITGDVEGCNNVSDEDQREQCVKTASDIDLYTNAVTNNDPALCANITDLTIKDACERLLNYGIENVLTEV